VNIPPEQTNKPKPELSPGLLQATPLKIATGRGSYLIDDKGEEYLDYTAGIGVTSTGHCHPRVVEAAQRQTARLIHGQYGIVRHDQLIELIDVLGNVVPTNLCSFFFANSGAEAVESAVRLARNYTGRQNVIAFHGSFHGRTLGAASLTTSNKRFRSTTSGMLAPGVVVAPFPTPFRYSWDEATTDKFCIRELDHIFATLSDPAETAAIIIEPVQGEAGYQPASKTFLQALRERADRYGIMLIADEVQSGVGRTGKFWAVEHFDVVPDILVFAKGIASGFPISGMAARPSVMAKATPGSQGGTFSANAVACAAAIATIQVIEEDGLVENARIMGAKLRAGLEDVAAGVRCVGDVRGIGLMQATEFVQEDETPAPEIARAAIKGAFDRGLILLTCGPYGNIVRMMPSLVINEQEVERGLRIWREAVAEANTASAT
jgi:4-aminobutyrate aminotransferase